MPGGATPSNRVAQKVHSLQFHGMNRHHRMYETDCVSHSNFGNTEQLQLERIIQSINVDITKNGSSTVAKLYSSTRHSQFTPEHISKIWNVGIEIAKDILHTTTQKGV